MLQTRFPRSLGDVGHPDNSGFAVRHRVIAGAAPSRVGGWTLG